MMAGIHEVLMYDHFTQCIQCHPYFRHIHRNLWTLQSMAMVPWSRKDTLPLRRRTLRQEAKPKRRATMTESHCTAQYCGDRRGEGQGVLFSCRLQPSAQE